MASTNRQNSLLATREWQQLYRTFTQADFKSYDFDTIRRTMIDYIQLNYAESFNDFIESSEFIALIDLIAYTAQSISYRVDLNARENFIDLAERKESVLRLARLISYQPKRNTAGNGFLKIDAVSTTETVFDSLGQDISNTSIQWNDVTNDNWQEQFNAVLNSSLPKDQFVGKPVAQDVIAGLTTELYRFNGSNLDAPLFPFNRNINGINMEFEAVPCSFIGESFIYEEAPIPGNSMSMIYKNDNKGFGSNNTGYFVHFRQGAVNTQDFTVTNTAPNTVVSITENNINNDDVFLFKLDNNGVINQRWTKVPAITGNNVIYNSLENNVNNQFAVITKTNDQVDLVFSDGVYGTLPKGNFRCAFRQSNGLNYYVQPTNMQSVAIDIEYVSRSGQTNTLTITGSLKSTVTNAAASESVQDIKTLAPQSYYTNNRMITPEDYQIVPRVQNPSIAKVKTQVRTSSGISRFLDITDPTGVYSSTNIVADDGMLYTESDNESFDFSFTTSADVQQVINGALATTIKSSSVKQYYYSEYPSISGGTGRTWNKTTQTVNQVTGYFEDTGPLSLGTSTTTNLRYITSGALLKFTAPTGSHFMAANGTLMTGTAGHPGSSDTIWTKVISVEGDGSNGGLGNLSDGTGPVILNQLVPSTAVLSEIIPDYITTLTPSVQTTIIANVIAYKNFGLGYNTISRAWYVIAESDLDTTSSFSITNQGNTTNANLDASWLIRFDTNGVSYTVTNRSKRYVFQSFSKNKFYFDESVQISDPETGYTIKDKIRVLKSNTQPDFVSNLTYNYDWQIVKNIFAEDGYSDGRKMQVGFFDVDDDGVVDRPDLFDLIVEPTTDVANKYVFFQDTVEGGESVTNPISNTNFVIVQSSTAITDFTIYPNSQLFYYYGDNTFFQYSSTTGLTSAVTGYTAKIGRQDLIYNYEHGAPRSRRIDPAVSNIIDMYVMTRPFDTAFRTWLNNGQITTRPVAPTLDDLETSYLGTLDDVKSTSDEIIINPGNYKLIFGPGSDSQLQAQFKIVKNPQTNVSDNQIKSDCIAAINTYFSLDLWDFGDTFYFTELAAYIHNVLAPEVLSVVIVPAQADNGFGSLFQINSQDNEIVISSATVDNVDIISSISADKLKSTGTVVTSTDTTSTTSTVATVSSVSSTASTTSSGTTSTSTSTTTPSSSSSSSGSSSGGYY